MEPLIKLTDVNGKTRAEFLNATQWGEGVEHRPETGHEPVLCTPGVIHAYASCAQAEMMDPFHGRFGRFGRNGVMWEAEGNVVVHAQDQMGCARLRTLRRIERKIPWCWERVKFAAYVVLASDDNWYFSNDWRKIALECLKEKHKTWRISLPTLRELHNVTDMARNTSTHRNLIAAVHVTAAIDMLQSASVSEESLAIVVANAARYAMKGLPSGVSLADLADKAMEDELIW